MIISKPKKSTLLKLGLFLLLINLGLLYIYNILKETKYNLLYTYLLIFVVSFISLAVTIKIFSGYKIISIGNGTFEVKYPIWLGSYKTDVASLEKWQEIMIQTKSGVYKQIAISFPGKRVKLSNHESSNYEAIHKYLLKRFSKSEVKNI